MSAELNEVMLADVNENFATSNQICSAVISKIFADAVRKEHGEHKACGRIHISQKHNGVEYKSVVWILDRWLILLKPFLTPKIERCNFHIKISGVECVKVNQDERDNYECDYYFRVDSNTNSKAFLQFLSPLTRSCDSLGYVFSKDDEIPSQFEYEIETQKQLDDECENLEQELNITAIQPNKKRKIVAPNDTTRLSWFKNSSPLYNSSSTGNSLPLDTNHTLLSYQSKDKPTVLEKCWQEPSIEEVIKNKYSYLPIKECTVRKELCFYGFVISIAELKQCNGVHKWSQQLRIRDGSIKEQKGGLQLLIFGNNPNNFPKPSVGDIVRIHRVDTEAYRDYIQCKMSLYETFKDPSFIVVTQQEYKKKYMNMNSNSSTPKKDTLFDFLQNDNCQKFVKQVSSHGTYQWNPKIDPFVCYHLFRLFDEWSQSNADTTNNTCNTTTPKITNKTGPSTTSTIVGKTMHHSETSLFWNGNGNIPNGNGISPTILQDLTALRPRDHLVVMIVWKSEMRVDDDNCLDWYVWDGTRSALLYDWRSFIENNPKAVHVNTHVGAYVKIQFQERVDRSWVKHMNSTASIGSWVYLSNVRVLSSKETSNITIGRTSPTLNLILDSKESEAKLLTPSNDRVVRDRLDFVYRTLGSTSVITQLKSSSYARQFYTPIASLKCIGIPNEIYRIRGNVVGYEPSEISSFLIESSSSSTNNDIDSNELHEKKSEFLFALKVKDSSDIIKIMVFGENAEILLGIKAKDFQKQKHEEELSNKMNALISQANIFDACIRSYIVKIDSNILSSLGYETIDKPILGYHLINTALLPGVSVLSYF